MPSCTTTRENKVGSSAAAIRPATWLRMPVISRLTLGTPLRVRAQSVVELKQVGLGLHTHILSVGERPGISDLHWLVAHDLSQFLALRDRPSGAFRGVPRYRRAD